MWSVRFTRRAAKELAALDRKQRLLLEGWIIDNLEGCENPRTVPGGKHLVGTDGGWRYRVGSYRILCRLLDGEVIVEVVRIGHKQGVYANIPKM